MNKIINLTQHAATPSQIADGVIDLDSQTLLQLKEFLTIDELPTAQDLKYRAMQILVLALDLSQKYETLDFMLGGHLDLMSFVHAEFFRVGLKPRSSFSKRNVIETQQPDGTVSKVAIFEHIGWTYPCNRF